MDEYLVPGGGWSLLLAVLFTVAFLGFVLFASGKPSDLGKPNWKVWIGVGVAMLIILFLLSRGVANLDFNACRDPRQVC